MTKEKQTELVEAATDRLLSDLDNGKSQALTDYLAICAQFHNYSFRNCILIAMQRPNCSRVAGFQAWKKLGRSVNKGEKGIAIMAPLAYKDKETEETEIYGFRAVYVFDVSQTNGTDLPEVDRAKGDPADYTNRLKKYLDKKQIVLVYIETAPGLAGFSSGGKITLKAGMEKAEEFSTLVHELAHEFLHHVKGEKLTKTQMETEAEAVAFIVNTFAGLDSGNGCSDYIQAHNGDRTELVKSLARVQATAKDIISELTSTR